MIVCSGRGGRGIREALIFGGGGLHSETGLDENTKFSKTSK